MTEMIKTAKEQVSQLVRQAYDKAVESGKLPAGVEVNDRVDIPKDTKNGDYASNYAMVSAKPMKMAPKAIAEAIVENLELEGSCFASAEIAGAGFMNFRLSPKWYGDVLRGIEADGKDYGCVNEGHGEKVMVEFVSANPTGPMTIGNARGGVLGDSLASVLEKAGYDVWREFYVNDAGNQVELFGRSIEARYLQLIQGEDAVEFPEDGYHGQDIVELAQLIYDKEGDKYLSVEPAVRREEMMRFGIERNIGLMHQHLDRYGIQYDCWFRESSLHESGYVAETVKLLEDSGHTYEKDGALWFKTTDFGADKDEVLRRSNGFYTYFAVDMAYHCDKFIKRGFDRVIDVWGADHHGHAIRFKASIGALGIDNSKLDFLIMQLVRLVKDGETVKVSKRTGKAITLNDLLDEISVDACRFSFNARPDTHLEFDMGLAVRQDSENPVYYVQYAHARICSLIAALKAEGSEVPSASDIDEALLCTEEEKDLIKQLSALPEEVRSAARDYDPSKINRYLIELASRFHRFYNACRIKGEEEKLLAARLCLASKTRDVLAIGLAILGISAPEKM